MIVHPDPLYRIITKLFSRVLDRLNERYCLHYFTSCPILHVCRLYANKTNKKPLPHGNRKGLSYGQLSVLFLSYVVSQSDHRLCAVETWVEKHRKTLEMATGWNIGVKDATDDRLADLLSM